MPNILKTRGIVLRTYPFRESSLFCSIFTEKFGKLKLIAKGARRPKSKFCGAFEPFTHSEVIFYKKETKEVYTISDAVIVDDYKNLRTSEKNFIASEAICEFVDKIAVVEEPNQELYLELLESLEIISSARDNISGLWVILTLFRLLKFAGLDPHLKDCVRCQRQLSGEKILNFSISEGGLVCENHFDDTVIKVDNGMITYILEVKKGEYPHSPDTRAFSTLKNLFESYIFCHLNSLTLNSLGFIKE